MPLSYCIRGSWLISPPSSSSHVLLIALLSVRRWHLWHIAAEQKLLWLDSTPPIQVITDRDYHRTQASLLEGHQEVFLGALRVMPRNLYSRDFAGLLHLSLRVWGT
ncbi:MAG: hypothetical protein H5T86_04810 [Armatimonadetes bacterium]|nr:hypothetical protein [Armatimonadota bacterium]